MISRPDIRNQMILPEQRSLYDYWRAKCAGGRLPSRFEIDPSEVTRHLPKVSLIEPESDRFKISLAGTDYWDIYDDEITGSYVDELPIGDICTYWTRVLERVVKRAKPAIGVTPVGLGHKPHLLQFWMRLPLSEDGKTVSMILGHDVTMAMSTAAQTARQFDRLTA